jgi:hypothetical protein
MRPAFGAKQLGEPTVKKTLVYCLAILLSSQALWAQISNNTALVGTVLDGTGSAVSGAKVTAVEQSTKVSSSATTNAEGYYAITFIKSGTYDITVEQKGFKKATTVGVTVAIDTSARTDFSLNVGSVAEEVTVSANTPPISTDDANLGETFATKQVDELPINGRNALEIAALASNVTVGVKTNYSGNPPGEDFNGAGQRETQNAITLDGVSIMNNLGNVTPARPSTDMISEVQMQSGNYPAQYGAYLGVHINLVSKSGTNDLHGTVYEYFKNTDLNARFAYDCTSIGGRCSQINRKAALNYNQYGFALGGPVFIPKVFDGHNKVFFFGSYEKLNQKAQSTGTSTVLTAKMRAGDFSELLPNTIIRDPTGQPYPGNIIPAARLATGSAAIAQKYIAYVPLPNATGTVNNLANAVFPNNLWVAQSLDRVDANVGEKVRLFARYHWQNLTYANGNAVPVGSSFGPANSRNLAIGYTHIITPHFINDFHVGINTLITNFVNYWYVNGLKDAGTQLGIPGFNYDSTTGNPGIPNVRVANATGMNIGNDGTNWFQDDRTVDAFDQVSYTRGKHNIMAGLEFRKLTLGRAATNISLGQFNFTGASNGTGTTTGWAPADFVLGLAHDSTTPVATIKGSVAEWRDGFFVLDNWQALPNLTINYGLRYDLPTVPYSLNGYARILNPAQTALLLPSTATTPNAFVPTPGLKFANPTHDNWGPRFGFAYRATDKLAVRGGVGFYYNANQLNSFTLLTSNYPLGAAVNYTTVPAPIGPLTFTNPTPGAGTASPVAGIPGTYVAVVNYDPNNKTQRSYQWNLSVGYELWKGAGAEVQYLGSHSFHLDRSFYNNEPLLPTAGTVLTFATPPSVNSRRPNQLFGSIRTLENDAYSNYNGMTAIFRQRIFHGLSGQGSYTWSKNLDLSSDSNGGGTLSQQYNPRADYGPSNWDITHRFVGILSYELPRFNSSNLLVRETLGGWQVNTIVNLQTGTPINVVLNYNSANNLQGTQRPSFVHKPKQTCSTKNYINRVQANPESCIDTTAYVLPVAPQTRDAAGNITGYNYAFGNTSRNTLHGPGFSYANLSVFKNFQIYERLRFQFRAEAFNVFNHPSAANPSLSAPALSQSSNLSSNAVGVSGFGQVTDTQKIPGQLSGARVMQLSGKIVF